MPSTHLVTGILLIAFLCLPLATATAVTTPPQTAETANAMGVVDTGIETNMSNTSMNRDRGKNVTAGPARVFIADDRDPLAGSIPPFVIRRLVDAVRTENLSTTNASRARDFTYRTTRPSVAVGSHNHSLREYRRSQLRAFDQNNSASHWLSTSNRSNGTVVKNAHITLLGALDGTRTRLGNHTEAMNGSAVNRSQFLLPRNGTVMAVTDYQTVAPVNRCSITVRTPLNQSVDANQSRLNQTNATANKSQARYRICQNYSVRDQRVTRTLRIGNQTWVGQNETPHLLTYSNARAEEPTELAVRATINTTVTRRTTTAVRTNDGWKQVNQTTNQTTLSHTVHDRARTVITTNQRLTATQTLVVNEKGQLQKIVLRTEGPSRVTERRLWSYATFKGDAGRLRNVWGLYSQRQTGRTTATRGVVAPNVTNRSGVNGTEARRVNATLANASRVNRSPRLAQPVPVTTLRQDVVLVPNVLTMQLTANRLHPAITRTDSQDALNAPEIVRTEMTNLSAEPAPVSLNVNVSSVRPRTPRMIVVGNVKTPLSKLTDIHGDSIPLTTRTVHERNAVLQTTVLNDTHARIQLEDAETGQPLGGRSLWLSGATQGHVRTNDAGVALVKRRDLSVTASFTGATNTSRNAFYGPTRTQIEFTQTPFNIYRVVSSLTGALLSVAAFLILFLPFAYLRR